MISLHAYIASCSFDDNALPLGSSLISLTARAKALEPSQATSSLVVPLQDPVDAKITMIQSKTPTIMPRNVFRSQVILRFTKVPKKLEVPKKLGVLKKAEEALVVPSVEEEVAIG